MLPVLIALLAVAGPGTASAASPAFPLLREAHAHNDYEHARPLFDALDQGFCSVEADIHLVDGELRVAHALSATRPGRTLESLYLDPLQERVRAHHGHVYPEASEFTLLIDIKTDADSTYAVLRQVLRKHRRMLTQFTATRTERRAITVILSGERPIERVKAERTRWCAIDGRLPDLDSNPSVHLVPLVSSSWSSTFSWRGEGEFPPQEAGRLRGIVARAHAQGRRIRFWGVGDDPKSWRVLQEAGVDVLNADDLPGLRAFILSHPNPPLR
jgi:hypothetical protein